MASYYMERFVVVATAEEQRSRGAEEQRSN
jgi:hypothetical protein